MTDTALRSGTKTSSPKVSSGGSISGRTTDGSGAPIDFISVSVQEYNGSSWSGVGGDFTDDNGNYEVAGLLTRTYRVCFSDFEDRVVDECYDNAADVESATDISVTFGRAVTGIDADFGNAPDPIYSITVTANPSAGGSVDCDPNPVSRGADSTCTATPNDGYRFDTWSGDCSGASCTLNNVASTKSVTANFDALWRR